VEELVVTTENASTPGITTNTPTGEVLRSEVPILGSVKVYDGHGPMRLVTEVAETEAKGAKLVFVVDLAYQALSCRATLDGQRVTVELGLRDVLYQLADHALWALRIGDGSEATAHLSAARDHLRSVRGSLRAKAAAELLDAELGREQTGDAR
jgi:hypothetical protein